MTALLSLEQTIKQYNLMPQKQLGQNFLLDLGITRRIVKGSGDFSGCDVVEVGPGPGALTRALLESDAIKVYGIEFDQRCVLALENLKSHYPEKLSIVQGDALRIAPQSLTSNPIKIVANLPYNISTTLLTQWLDNLMGIESMTLMFQKEVADRIIASPGSKDYGRLSIIVQFMCETNRLFNLPPGAFTPAPKVDSSVVYFKPKTLTAEMQALKPYIEKVAKAAFSQRRKMIRSTLKDVVPVPELEALGIDPTLRAENLDLNQYIQMAHVLRNRRG